MYIYKRDSFSNFIGGVIGLVTSKEDFWRTYYEFFSSGNRIEDKFLFNINLER